MTLCPAWSAPRLTGPAGGRPRTSVTPVPLRNLPPVDRLTLSTVASVPEWHPERDAFVPFPVHVWIIHHPDGPILMDTGVGLGNEAIDGWYHPRSTPIGDALVTVGLAPSEVAAVVLSHLHFDHCGQQRTVSAPTYVQAAEWAASKAPGYTVPEWADVPEARLRTRSWRGGHCRWSPSAPDARSHAGPSIDGDRSRGNAIGTGGTVCLPSRGTPCRTACVHEPPRPNVGGCRH